MWRVAAILAAVAAFVYVAVVGVQWLQPRVEGDIQNRVTTSLAEQGLLWADVDVSGRQVVLRGEAPDANARDQALTVATRVFGVAGVSDATVLADPSLTVAAEPVPYQLVIVKNAESLTLNGQVANKDDADVIMRIVKTHYPDASVEDELEVEAGAPAGWRSAVGVVLMNLTNLEVAQVTLSGTEVMLEGEVLSQDFSDQAETRIAAALPKNYKIAFAVDVVTPTVAASVSETAAVSEAVSVSAPASKTEAVEAKPAERAKAPAEEAAASVAAAKPEGSLLEKALAAVAPAAGPDAAQTVENCPGIERVATEKVMFGFDKAEVSKDQMPVIGRVATTLKACPNEPVTVAGYTDTTGSRLYNKWLSEQRAESGVRALMREGVARTQLAAVGYGVENPVASNKTKAGRAANRRIEFQPGHAGSAAKPVSVTVTVSEAATAPSDTANSAWWANLGAMLNGSKTASATAVSGTVK